MTTIDNETGDIVPVDINSPENLAKLNKEVEAEFKTSKEKVYKDALRSLLHQEQELARQTSEIQRDLQKIKAVREALEKAFLAGELRTRDDATVVAQAATQELLQIGNTKYQRARG